MLVGRQTYRCLLIASSYETGRGKRREEEEDTPKSHKDTNPVGSVTRPYDLIVLLTFLLQI